MQKGKIVDLKYDSSGIDEIGSKLSAVMEYEPEENDDSDFIFNQNSNLTLCSQGDMSEMISIEHESRQTYMRDHNKNDLKHLKIGLEPDSQVGMKFNLNLAKGFFL